MTSWQPEGLGATIFNDRYTRYEGETWEQASRRVAEHVAKAEENGKYQKFTERFYDEIVSNKFMPGGRIWYGSGRPKAQLLNCFVVPTSDSREGWGKTISDVIVVSGTGGGVGINCSPVRPRGSDIKGTGGKATGPVSLMQMIDRVGDVLVSGGGRRLALMLDLDITHPDLQEFLNVKLDLNQLTNANISVVLNTPSDEFVTAVREARDIPYHFGGRATGDSFSAADVWKTIVNNSWKSGEPGVLNGYEANRMSNIWYYKPLISTNPCLTGDTRIMTVDGPRTFSSLAEEGKDVLVYSWHPKTKKPVMRWMRNPRATRRKAQILEIEFDSGLKLRGTPDHSLYSFRGKKVKLEDLKIGSSVRAWSMSKHRDGHLRVHGWNSEKNLSEHQWVARMVWENAYGPINNESIIHHKNEVKDDNRLENLELIENNSEHNKLHYAERFANGFDGTAKNHKVVAIRSAGVEDVYNGTVDDSHSYIVLDPEPIAGIASGIVSANCGEIWLEEYGCCDLGALVLPRFVESGVFNWDSFDSSIRSAVRFLDDVLTVNNYPLEDIKRNCEAVRRIGLGVMGLHTMLLELGYKYSSPEGQAFIDKLFSFLKNVSYDASINLAIEKGPFPAYDERFLDSGFVKTLKRGVRGKIREHGIRNCALLTIAPTGTTGMVSGVSTGIEPLFAPVYWRTYFKPTDDGSRERAKELVVTPEFEKYGELAEGAYDLTPRQHFEMQKIVQSHIDNAVSKTINIPKDYPVEELSDVWLDYLPFLKGTTLYREGSRDFEPLEPVRSGDIKGLIKKTKDIVHEFNAIDQAEMDCPDGVCELPEGYLSQLMETK